MYREIPRELGRAALFSTDLCPPIWVERPGCVAPHGVSRVCRGRPMSPGRAVSGGRDGVFARTAPSRAPGTRGSRKRVTSRRMRCKRAAAWRRNRGGMRVSGGKWLVGGHESSNMPQLTGRNDALSLTFARTAPSRAPGTCGSRKRVQLTETTRSACHSREATRRHGPIPTRPNSSTRRATGTTRPAARTPRRATRSGSSAGLRGCGAGRTSGLSRAVPRGSGSWAARQRRGARSTPPR